MIKNICLAFFAILFSSSVMAQNEAVVKLIIPDNGKYFNFSDLLIYRMENGQLLMNMSVLTTGEETIIKIPVEKGETEMVRMLYNTKDGKYFDLFIPDGDTSIVQMNVYPTESKYPKILKGNMNKDYYEYIVQKEGYETRNGEMLEQYAKATSKAEKKEIASKIEDNRKEFEIVCWQLTKQNQRNLLGSYIYNNPIRKTNVKLSETEQTKILIDNYWKDINLTDVKLLKTFLFRDLLENYITLYYIDGLLPAQQDSALIVSVKKAMDVFSQSEEHYNFAYNFLIYGFEVLQNSELVSYMVTHYTAPDQCETDGPDEKTRNEMEANERMRPGKPAPDIALHKTDGTQFSIKDIQADTVLVIFFSSTCPHCTKAMPQVVSLLKNTNIKVVAVSADREPSEYYSYIKNYPDWIHYCDFKAGDSKPIIDYNIKGTPTYVLLDKEKRIIDKYRTIDQLKQVIVKKR